MTRVECSNTMVEPTRVARDQGDRFLVSTVHNGRFDETVVFDLVTDDGTEYPSHRDALAVVRIAERLDADGDMLTPGLLVQAMGTYCHTDTLVAAIAEATVALGSQTE